MLMMDRGFRWMDYTLVRMSVRSTRVPRGHWGADDCRGKSCTSRGAEDMTVPDVLAVVGEVVHVVLMMTEFVFVFQTRQERDTSTLVSHELVEVVKVECSSVNAIHR